MSNVALSTRRLLLLALVSSALLTTVRDGAASSVLSSQPPQASAAAEACPAPPAIQGTQDRLEWRVAEGDRLRETREYAAARSCFDAIRRDAQAAGTARLEAAALLGLARTVVVDAGDRTAARAIYEQALTLARGIGDRSGEVAVLRHHGINLYYLGDEAAGRAAVQQAIAIARELDDRRALAQAYAAIVYLVDDGPEKDAQREDGLRLARETGERASECKLLHEWGDEYFNHGDYVNAQLRLIEAEGCFESVQQPSDVGRVLTSLGRVQRAHGQLHAALGYYVRALALQERANDDKLAIVQSLNAIAVTYQYLGQHDEAKDFYERAFAQAQAINSASAIGFLQGQLGGLYLRMGECEKAVPLLEASIAGPSTTYRGHRYTQLSWCHAEIGDLDKALELAEKAIVESKPRQQREWYAAALRNRADILGIRGDLAAARRDLAEAIELVETAREKTIPLDFMKRGYSDMHQNLFASTIDLLAREGRWRLALETAEQARARAFLDLLASRTLLDPASGAMVQVEGLPLLMDVIAPLRTAVQGEAPIGPQTQGDVRVQETPMPPDAAARALALQRAVAQAPRKKTPRSELVNDPIVPTPDPRPIDIESLRSAPPADTGAMIATARRLRSTLLAYWVGQNATYAWVVSPSGEVQAKRIAVASGKLETLVAQAADTMDETQQGGLALMGGSQTRPWRELHTLLIKPVRQFLPATPNSLLTIVPHGPLFRLSFAALQNERGQYLVETYRLHYTPAIGVLEFTGRLRRAQTATASKAPKQALLIGDPGPVSQRIAGVDLPALPWARREVDAIAAQLPSGSPHILIDETASERDVRKQMAGMDLVHFATHGVVDRQSTLSSFLALRGGGADADTTNDGRLTAEEVYALSLRARLVVLSACGTALGPMTGDGVIGFTRAFLYAGASSVIATEWDVPDAAGYELMRRFYRSRATSGNESRALRAAQLGMIAALRKGELTMEAPGGATVALPEHPMLWAGFVLVGEP